MAAAAAAAATTTATGAGCYTARAKRHALALVNFD